MSSKIKLTNPTNDRVCFKVKTTAPKRYCVRPNNGVIEPNSTTNVIVMLQPFDFEAAPDKNKHKFMIQTLVEPDDIDTPENMVTKTPFTVNYHFYVSLFDLLFCLLSVFWEQWKTYSNSTMDSKLKCVFDNSDSAEIGDAVNKVKSENASAESNFSSHVSQHDTAFEPDEYNDRIFSAEDETQVRMFLFTSI